MPTLLSTTTIGVMGSGSDEHESPAGEVGALLASLGVNLLTGGGGGVMRSVSRAYTAAPRERGICIGIIPCRSIEERNRPKDGYPNEFIELPIYTHLPFSSRDDLSRNHINVLSCAAVVVLPGESGTASEVQLALEYGRPLIVYSALPVPGFPEEVRRVGSIEEVREFLLEVL